MCGVSVADDRRNACVWVSRQATWLYLEPIFGSDDIQKQMPKESAMFATVDGHWRAIMVAVVATPACVKVAKARTTTFVWCAVISFAVTYIHCLCRPAKDGDASVWGV